MVLGERRFLMSEVPMYCDPKGSRAFLRTRSTLVAPNPPQGVLVRGQAGLVMSKLVSRKGEVSAYVGRRQNPKDIKDQPKGPNEKTSGNATHHSTSGGETSRYAFTHPNRTTRYLLYTSLCTRELNATRKQKCFICSPLYGRTCRWAM